MLWRKPRLGSWSRLAFGLLTGDREHIMPSVSLCRCLLVGEDEESQLKQTVNGLEGT